MFIDASPKYTNTDLNYKKENPIVVERFVQEGRNIVNYSHTKMVVSLKTENAPNYSYALREERSTSEKLKRAMFKTSSRGVAAALSKGKW